MNIINELWDCCLARLGGKSEVDVLIVVSSAVNEFLDHIEHINCKGMDNPTFKLETVNKLLQIFFHDKPKTKLLSITSQMCSIYFLICNQVVDANLRRLVDACEEYLLIIGNGDALKLMTELLRIFIAEGAARAAQQAKVESSPTVETDHLEKILPQLLLDF